MNLNSVVSAISRVFFAAAFILAVLAVVKGAVQLGGGSMLGDYTPGRLLEFAAVLLIFVIACLLRQIRDGLKSGG